MLIDRTHRRWAWFSLAAFVVATIVYVPYHLRSAKGPSGGGFLGLTFGIAGSALMIYVALLAARKKVPTWRVGRAQTWMRGHLWLGLLIVPLIVYHSGFSLGGTLTTVLMVLLGLVTASGIFGAILQQYLPRVMTTGVPKETIYEEIGHIRGLLLEEAEKHIEASRSKHVQGGSTPSLTGTVIASTAKPRVPHEALDSFYQLEIRPFLERPNERLHPLADPKQAQWKFQQLRTLLPPELHAIAGELEDICEEERQLNRQEKLHRWLHGWLLVHVPLSYALLVLGLVHAIMALRY